MNKMKLVKKIVAAALVGTLALSTAVVNINTITVKAADSAVPTNSPTISLAKVIGEDGTVSITLKWNSEDMRTFDYGVLFDETKLEFVNMSFSENFSEKYQWDGTSGEGGVPVFGEVKSDEGSYITLGGVYYGTEKYDGEVATLNFEMKEGAEGAGVIKIVKDSSTYSSLADMKAATPFKIVDLDSTILMGDVDGNGDVDSDDAVQILKHFAGLIELTGDEFTAADVDYNGDVDSDDAVEVLKYFAGLPSLLD